MNLSTPLLALLAANRMGDSSSDSGRVAMLAMMIRPPMMGLMIAMMVARQKAQKPKAVVTKVTGGGTAVIDQIVPKPDRSFFPSFEGLTRREASHQAKRLGLNVTFDVSPSSTGEKEVVIHQDPKEGSNWPRDVVSVALRLG
jgi:hypothetical protein